MRVKHFLALAIVAVLALAAAGCGSDDSNKTLSSNDLITQANKICKDANTKSKEIPQPTDTKSVQTYLEKQLAIVEPAVNEVKDLKPPAELEAGYNQFVADSEKAIEQSKQAIEAAKADDQQKLQQIADEGQALDKQADANAKKLGLNDCAQN